MGGFILILFSALQSTVSAGQSSQRVRGQGNQKNCNGRTAGQQGYEDNCGTNFVFSSRDPDSSKSHCYISENRPGDWKLF